MRKSLLLVMLFCLPAFAHQGIFHGVEADLGVAAKTVSYPVRHPVKSLKASGKAVKATFKAAHKF